MILHDISDPLMEAAKLFNYSKCKRASNAFFLTFALTFVYTRVYLFPRHIIYAAWRFMALFDFPFINVTLFCFASLWCLHVFWSFLVHPQHALTCRSLRFSRMPSSRETTRAMCARRTKATRTRQQACANPVVYAELPSGQKLVVCDAAPVYVTVHPAVRIRCVH